MKIKEIGIMAILLIAVILSGCTGQQEQPKTDSDNDGSPDASDDFPHDRAVSVDTDGDGYPDAWNEGYNSSAEDPELFIDAFPNDPTEWKDSDGDGYGDNSDQLPLDSKHHKITYLINERTDTIDSGDELEQNIEIKSQYKDIVFYWRLSTSDELAGQTIYMRYKTPVEWSTKYRGITNSVQRQVTILGTWLFVLGHEGQVTGYTSPITITYRVYALE